MYENQPLVYKIGFKNDLELTSKLSWTPSLITTFYIKNDFLYKKTDFLYKNTTFSIKNGLLENCEESRLG